MGMASGELPYPVASPENHEFETLGRHITGQDTTNIDQDGGEAVEESMSHSGGSVMQESSLASDLNQVNLSISHSDDHQEDKLVGFQPVHAYSQKPVAEVEVPDGQSVHTSDDSSSGLKKVNGNAWLENEEEYGNVVPFLDSTKEDGRVVPSKVHCDNEKTEEGLLEDEAGPEKEAGRPYEAFQGSAPLCMDPYITTETVSSKAVWYSEASLCHMGIEEVENSVSVDKQERKKEGSSFKALVTMDMDGWQRFDAEELNTDVDTTDGIAQQSTELWEHLLDVGVDGHDKDAQIPPLQIASAPFPRGEDQHGLPSPGNPFVEGLERISSFSEVEGSIFHGGDLHSSHYLLQSVEQQPSLPEMEESYHGIEESSSDMSGMQHTLVDVPGRLSSLSEVEGSIVHGESHSSHGLPQSFEEQPSLPEIQESHHNVSGIEETSSSIPGISQPTAVSVGEDAKQPEAIDRSRQPSQTSFSQIRSSSFDAMEPCEAPSFMSLVDPKTSALFAAFMPTYQASSSVQGQENGGERWVANFELMAPPAQEISRSMSLPRAEAEEEAEAPSAPPIGKGEGHSFSFTTRTVQAPEKEMVSPADSRPDASPKVRPLVQKVVSKVRTTHAVANGVLNSVRQVIAPKAAGNDKAAPSKETWLRRICC